MKRQKCDKDNYI